MEQKEYWTSIWNEYQKNEKNNCHSDNVVLMVKSVGIDEDDIIESETILREHERIGFLTSELKIRRDRLDQKYWSMFKKMVNVYTTGKRPRKTCK